jgi:endonuclease/exonuclease/phosphatase family metal-dependent hydrolase
MENDREKQYEVISQYINNEIDQSTPLILAGDFNDWKKLSCQKLGCDLNLQEAVLTHHGK